jgi:hypothetical protein
MGDCWLVLSSRCKAPAVSTPASTWDCLQACSRGSLSSWGPCQARSKPGSPASGGSGRLAGLLRAGEARRGRLAGLRDALRALRGGEGVRRHGLRRRGERRPSLAPDLPLPLDLDLDLDLRLDLRLGLDLDLDLELALALALALSRDRDWDRDRDRDRRLWCCPWLPRLPLGCPAPAAAAAIAASPAAAASSGAGCGCGRGGCCFWLPRLPGERMPGAQQPLLVAGAWSASPPGVPRG